MNYEILAIAAHHVLPSACRFASNAANDRRDSLFNDALMSARIQITRTIGQHKFARIIEKQSDVFSANSSPYYRYLTALVRKCMTLTAVARRDFYEKHVVREPPLYPGVLLILLFGPPDSDPRSRLLPRFNVIGDARGSRMSGAPGLWKRGFCLPISPAPSRASLEATTGRSCCQGGTENLSRYYLDSRYANAVIRGWLWRHVQNILWKCTFRNILRGIPYSQLLELHGTRMCIMYLSTVHVDRNPTAIVCAVVVRSALCSHGSFAMGGCQRD